MISKPEHKLALVSTSVTLLIAVVFFLYFQEDQLPKDLKIVHSSETVAPFFQSVFGDAGATELLLNDPLTIVRGSPLFPTGLVVGPHDLLGFRNYSVPNHADIVAIGDSQTYGMNALISDSWPQQLAKLKNSSVYSMAVGGWGAVQYLAMLKYAKRFSPHVIVVGIYTGNDSLESFKAAYGITEFESLIPNPELTLSDLPAIPFPPPQDSEWATSFGSETMRFTPQTRFSANDRKSVVVQAGYEIIRSVLVQMLQELSGTGIKLTVLFIPSKELVYSETVSDPRGDYAQLVADENKNYLELVNYCESLERATCVESLSSLRAAISGTAPIYPPSADGHPLAAGYAAIAEILNRAIKLSTLPEGVYLADKRYYLLKDGKRFYLAAGDNQKYGPATEVKPVELEGFELAGILR